MTDKPGQFQSVSIIGLGLIGGSVALGLKRNNQLCKVTAFDANPLSLQKGLELGVIDVAANSVADAIDGADLVLLAVPVQSVAAVLSQITPAQFGQMTVTDVCSVKSPILKAAKEIFGKIPKSLIPGHPIAGSEKHGVSMADGTLFQQHRVILTPVHETNADALQSVEAMWQELGADVVIMDPDHHDAVLAQTSHLPHLLAYALVDTLSSQGDSLEIFQYAAGGFRDFSRIAASDPTMWRDIFQANQKELLRILDVYLGNLADIRRVIESNSGEELESILARAKSARDYFSEIELAKMPHSDTGRVEGIPNDLKQKTALAVDSDSLSVGKKVGGMPLNLAIPVIAIDGPSGSGKGVVTMHLAKRYGYHMLDSGALYRLVGLAARQKEVDLDVETLDTEALSLIAATLDVQFTPTGDPDEPLEITLDGRKVTGLIRTDAAGIDASRVAAVPGVRTALINVQRAARRRPGLIADGRDMGTVLFPDADVKIFLTASPEARAQRRYNQLKGKDIGVSLHDLFLSIEARDERDTNRSVSPLIPADDAFVIDSTDLDIDAVVDQVMRIVTEKLA